MATERRVVVGKQVLTSAGLRPASIHIVDGRIERVGPPEDLGEAAAGGSLIDVIDAGDAVVVPGIVDTHVHVNEPGRTEWEGFASATAAAAAGGVTTLVDMPLNSIPPTTTVRNLLTKAAAMEGRIAVDVGLWGGAIPGNAPELAALLDEGALGFKCFMVDSGVDEFPYCTEGDVRAAMMALRDRGAPLLVHAELPGPLAEALAEADLPTDARSYERYLRSRPRKAEDEAIALLAALCRETGARTHVVHLSSASALDILRRARDGALPLSAETTPHYLSFASERIPDGATEYKCAPPIREELNQRGLWDGIREGLVSMVVTDHSPCTPELKRLEAGSFDDAWGGIASLQFGFSAVWTEAHARGIGLVECLRWMTEAPAALAGLAGRKGRIAPGHDADLVFLRPDETFVVTPSLVLHRHKVTPYAGKTLRGVVEATYLRGHKVYGRDAVGAVATPDPRRTGRWVKRA